MKKCCLLMIFSLFLLNSFQAFSQKAGSISGTVTDKKNNIPLTGVVIIIKGTVFGGVTDINGKYKIENIAPGNYLVEVSYLGYEKMLYTEIKVSDKENKVLNIAMNSSVVTLDQNIVIIGKKPLVDVESAKSGSQVTNEVINAAPSRQIQSILNTQTGVVQNAEGIHIRGGRTYETGFYIDDVSAQDPLAGTGFGIDIGSNSIDNIEISTSSSDVEFGDATAGVVNTKTKSGGRKFGLNASARRDNFGFNNDWYSVFNQQTYELGMGGPVKFGKTAAPKLKYFTSLKLNFSDTYIRRPADQVISSLYSNTKYSPFQDNRWAGMLKLNYDFSQTKKLSFTYLRSLTINQDINMLRITGNEVSFTPGYQFSFALQPDNANTYTHDTNLETVQWIQTPKPTFSYRVTASRLFVHLRADANGRPWRPQQVTGEFDPTSIVTFPTTVFNPNDSIVFVDPAPGLYNNGGIAILWHDHYVEEYTLKSTATFYSKNTMNKFYAGFEFKRQQMQWVDIVRPWIGAPILLNNGNYTQSFRLGDLSDVWKVSPVKGAFFASDQFKFRGLIANVGLRFQYWFPGKFVDDAIENQASPISDAIRKSYLNNTISVFGSRMKMRLLPKISASFPIKENQVMYFNYGHSTVDPHPSYLYTGLDPYYADRSTLSRIGNPDLNPEVDISYELGLKSQISLNDALNVVAYWKDKYDFITSASILIKDVTGREVNRTLRINSDYARVRGVEITYIKRVKRWFEGQISFAYSIATGQSSSSSQSLKDILATGNSVSSKELPLAWDSPVDAKAFSLFKYDKELGLFGKKYLNKASLYTEAIFRTGKRYTPYIFKGNEPSSGRPIYEVDSDPENQYSLISVPTFVINLSAKKWFEIKKVNFSIGFELTNLLNSKNTAIVNPVTGRAYEFGDPVPTESRDPKFIDPRDYRSNGLPPDNPARYAEQRHLLINASLKF